MHHDLSGTVDPTPDHPEAPSEPTTGAPPPSTLVWKYGLRAPCDGAALVDEQMALAHRYFNDLQRIEREGRSRIRQAELDAGLLPARDALVAARDSFDAAGAAWAAAGRPKSGPAADARQAAHDSLTAARKSFAASASAARASDAVKAAVARIREDVKAARIVARAASGVFWGTYLTVEDSQQQSLHRRSPSGAMQSIPLWDDGRPDDPSWRDREAGEGTVAVQLQSSAGPRTVADIMAGRNNSVRIEVEPLRAAPSRNGPPPDPNSKRSQRRGGTNYVLWLRVGSDPSRRPLWAKFSMVMHRALPPGAVVAWVHVHRTVIGARSRWDATFTIVSGARGAREPGRGGTVCVEFGWRSVQGGLRVATWVGEDGDPEHLVLPTELFDSMRHAEGIRGIRDGAFDEARAALLSLAARDHSMPAWLREEVADRHVAKWRCVERLEALVERLSRHFGVATTRVDYDAWAKPPVDRWGPRDLELWRRQSLHLHDYGDFQGVKARRRRKDLYRTFAAALARRYTTLVVEKFDIGEVALTPKTRTARAARTDQLADESDTAAAQAARSNRARVAVYELRTALTLAFRDESTYTINSFRNTQRCHVCGSEEFWDAAPDVRHTCSRCSSSWDQDVNHVLNMRPIFRAARAELDEARRARAAAKALRGPVNRRRRKAAPPPAGPVTVVGDGEPDRARRGCADDGEPETDRGDIAPDESESGDAP